MKQGVTRRKVGAFVRDYFDRFDEQPTCREIGDALGISAVAAWKHIQTLVGERKLIRLGGGMIALPDDDGSLSVVRTSDLKAELARRGETLSALDQPKMPMDEGRPCAANFCQERVGRGKLFCREHWFRLPPKMRSAIMNAWGARHVQDYQEAVEAARDHLGGFTRVVERVQ